MRHNLTATGSTYRLRPVEIADAAFIMALRTDPKRNRFINSTPPEIKRQVEWIESYFTRPNDYYFMVENVQTGDAEGTISIYDADPAQRTAEWGRWVLRSGSKAALPSVALLFRLAFEELHLELLKTHTVVENRSVISILERAGMREIRILPEYVQIDAVQYDVVEHQISRSDWVERRKSRPLTRG